VSGFSGSSQEAPWIEIPSAGGRCSISATHLVNSGPLFIFKQVVPLLQVGEIPL